MTVQQRWLRLDAGWDQSEWVLMLDPLSQLAWIKLLCHVKVWGKGGTVKAPSTMAAARMWNLPVKAVGRMLEAAQEDGALRITEASKDAVPKWEVPKWKQYQEPDRTAAERMRRMRAKNGVRLT